MWGLGTMVKPPSSKEAEILGAQGLVTHSWHHLTARKLRERPGPVAPGLHFTLWDPKSLLPWENGDS